MEKLLRKQTLTEFIKSDVYNFNVLTKFHQSYKNKLGNDIEYREGTLAKVVLGLVNDIFEFGTLARKLHPLDVRIEKISIEERQTNPEYRKF